MILNHLSISLLLVSATAFFSTIFILLNHPRTKGKLLWGIFNLIVTVWAIFLCYSSNDFPYENALFIGRVSQNLALLIPIVFFHFTCVLLQIEKNKYHLIRFFYGIAIFLNILLFLYPEYFISEIRPILDMPYYLKAGKLYALIPGFYFVTIGYSLILILQQYKISNQTRRNQLKYVFLGYIVGSSGGFTGFLAPFDIKIYPYGFYFVTLNILLVLYAIGKHQLMDIKIALNKSIVYTLLVSGLSLIYFCTIFLVENIFQNTLGYKSLPISLLLVCIISIFFIPLRNFIQQTIDRLLYKGNIHEITEKVELLEREVAEKEKFKAVATLASGMSHEIKNPLTAIKTFSEYLPKKLKDEAFLLKFSKIVSHEVKRIDSIVNQLLDFSKPAPLQRKKTDIHLLIDETLDFLNSKFIEKHIEIIRNYSTSVPGPRLQPRSGGAGEHQASSISYINIDPNQIRQVLLNLFLNAIDAMTHKDMLTVSTNTIADGTMYEIRIQDTGCGIPKNKLKEIFDPFYTQKDHGTGLGLAITKSIIEDHGGRIRALSEEGVGTEFIIELPMLDA